MELPFEIKAQSGRRSPSSTSSQKKSSKRKITLLIKAMFSKKFVVDIMRLTRERWLEVGTTVHRVQSKF